MTGKELFAHTLEKLERSHLTRTIPGRLLGASDYDPSFGARVCELTFRVVGSELRAYEQAVEDLIQLSQEFLEEQMFLERHGRYRYSTFAELEKHVYGRPEIMNRRYYTGLLLSQAFWINHYRMLRFFTERFASGLLPRGSVMEAPVGTGIYLSEFVRSNNSWSACGVDLGESALRFAEQVCLFNGGARAVFRRDDVFAFAPVDRFDRVICGELLEHVERPEELLRRLRAFVQPEGKVFLTTAVWAAAIDHIYLFESVEHVRRLIEPVFHIEDEICLSVFDHKQPNESRTPINYACIASPK